MFYDIRWIDIKWGLFDKKHLINSIVKVWTIVYNNFFIIFAPKSFNMTLQKWIKDRTIHGFPTFSIEDVRKTGMYSSEQILQNELYRLYSNKTIFHPSHDIVRILIWFRFHLGIRKMKQRNPNNHIFKIFRLMILKKYKHT